MRILVTGANGLLGNAIKEISSQYSQHDFIFVGRNECDLLNPKATHGLMIFYRPDTVVHTAARVGGIGRNLSQATQQYSENVLMNTNVVDAALHHGVKNLLTFGSVCAFPSDVDIFTEENYCKGEPFPAHKSYAYSKRGMDVHIEAIRNQFGLNYGTILPVNIFGKKDNYSLVDGHVVPMLIHKFYKAWKNNQPVFVWGDGTPMREFIYAEELAHYCIKLLDKEKIPHRLIVPGAEITIKELVHLIHTSFRLNYKVDIPYEFDINYPNGQMRRQTDTSLFYKIFKEEELKEVDLSIAIDESVRWFVDNYPDVRGV